ncbi:MAG: sulfite exporter TauE/SafE family protein [Acidobacteriota bacterium]
MEVTCTRCHQIVHVENSFCPICGLPQLVYTADDSDASGQPEPWNERAPNADNVDWKLALRFAAILGVPAGFLCSLFSPVGIFGLILMSAASAWAVVLYVRGQQTPWITTGAGARIGLVTGVLGGWTAVAATGVTLFLLRFVLHQGQIFDNFWQNFVGQDMSRQWASMGIDSHTVELTKSWLLSPEGRAGWVLGAMAFLGIVLLLFAVVGGALGARLLARTRRPEV